MSLEAVEHLSVLGGSDGAIEQRGLRGAAYLAAWGPQLVPPASTTSLHCPSCPMIARHPSRSPGLDELAPIAVATVATVTPSGVTMGSIDPFLMRFKQCTIADLKGGSAAENAAILRDVFSGKLEGPVTDTVILNAGAGLYVAGTAASVAEGCELARACLKAGKPLATLSAWVSASQAQPPN